METCFLLEVCRDVNNHKTNYNKEIVGICRNVETLVEVLHKTENYGEITTDNVFSFEMRQKYGYKIFEYPFLHWK